MGEIRGEEQLALPMPLGAQYVEALRHAPVEEVRALADSPEARKIFEATQFVMLQEPVGAFLHSALCAMSLPATRPKGDKEFEPIIRREGNLTLVVKPGERMMMGPDDKLTPVKLGVPFGPHARLIMIYIMTEAVKTRSREIFLGNSFAAWMRKMGLTSTNSGGARSSRALLQEQVERLMACEWTLRWDQDVSSAQPKRKGKKAGTEKMSAGAFSVNEIRLVTGYSGVTAGGGEFVSRFVLSEEFFGMLQKHMVPMNERAVAALRSSSHQLDLYSFLAMRLPKIMPGEEVILTWKQLQTHVGNDISTLPKLRQTIRRAWQTVSGVYQQARNSCDFGDLRIVLRHAEKPVDNQMVKRPNGSIELVSVRKETADDGTQQLAKAIRFPADGRIRFGHPELLSIAKTYGSNNDVDIIAAAFVRKIGDEISTLEGERLLLRFKAFCHGFRPV